MIQELSLPKVIEDARRIQMVEEIAKRTGMASGRESMRKNLNIGIGSIG
jgi:hypothetical protein